MMTIIKIFSAIMIVVFLQACGGQEQSVDFSAKKNTQLVDSSPLNKQGGVAIGEPLILVFSDAVVDEILLDSIQLFDESAQLVAINVEVDLTDATNVVVTPFQPLLYGERYYLDFSVLLSIVGVESDATGIVFTTRSEKSLVDVNPNNPTPTDPIEPGPTDPVDPIDPNNPTDPDPIDPIADEQDINGDGEVTPEDTVFVPVEYDVTEFYVAESFPQGNLPYLDVSVFHFTLSQEIDTNTVVLNQSFSLMKADESETVAGTLLVKGRYISFDPDADLDSNSQYTLVLTDAIKSLSGTALNSGEFSAKTFTPLSTMPRLNIVQKIFGEVGGPLSPVNSKTRNSVEVHSKLIGENISYAQGDYHAELAQVGSFPDVLPFVIRKGSVIKLSSMDVNIGGQFPAGFVTDDIYLTLISDAVGYLTPHNSGAGFNRKLSMVMDTAMTATNPLANGTLSQDVLNVNLGGLAVIDNGVLVVDAIGDISMSLLGIENVPSTASFFLQGYASPASAPSKIIDTTKPILHSWVPGELVDRSKLSDPILLTFSEPLSTKWINQNVQLLDGSGLQVPVSITQDGSVLVVKPHAALTAHTTYTVQVSENIQDLSGNTLAEPLVLSFNTERVDTSSLTAPMISSVYPGYNCRLTAPDLTNDIAGHCSGGLGGDDVYNIFTLPSNRNIEVNFTQLMNQQTITLGTECGQGAFRVERIDTSGDCLGVVSGAIHFDQSRLLFVPNEPWQEDTLYQYTVYSNKTAACDGSDDVPCSVYGLPLNTKPLKLKLSNRTEGSNAMRMPFYGAAAKTSHVFSTMSQMPTTDVNRNYTFDNSETPIAKNASKLWVQSTTGLISEARLGCKSGTCVDDEAIYVSGNLPTDIGQYDAENDWIPVTIYPQALMTTSITMFAKALKLIWLENPTGPQVMRVRHDYVDGKSVPNTGYIVWNEEHQQAYFKSKMNVYLDAPGLAPEILGIVMQTNMHSLPLTLELEGPVSFLPDGRMEIELTNTKMVDIDVVINTPINPSKVYLKIPKEALIINLVSSPVKS
ncbi:MAG: hypothetical protein ACI8SR_001235 [Oceanicoccus sp.]|jgi:hypothetical protein